MNVQTQELPHEAVLQALTADRAAQSLKEKDEKAVSVAAGQDVRQDQRDRPQEDESKPLSRDEVKKLVTKAQDYFKDKGVNLHFKVLDDSDELQVEVVDADSNKVIRKFPQDELLKLSDNLKRMSKGLMDKAV